MEMKVIDILCFNEIYFKSFSPAHHPFRPNFEMKIWGLANDILQKVSNVYRHVQQTEAIFLVMSDPSMNEL
jgi:hypothetical protein